MLKEIYARRSIRKFTQQDIADEDIIEIIESAAKAPSSKNRQPWKFIVVRGKEKEQMIEAFCRGIAREETGAALLPNSKQHIAAAKHTINIMRQAPAAVFVVNTLGRGLFEELTDEERVFEVCNIQSVSAAIQNMLLAAENKGIGSLWICDIFFAYKELCEWLGQDGELIAAVALGYPGEKPLPRPRKKFEDVILWRE